MIAKLKNGKCFLKRSVKYTTLCRRSGAVWQKWENDYVDRILGNFESQVKWFEENLKD